MGQEALIVFLKNPELGKVKTRIAQTVGDAKALAVYEELLAYNRTLVADCTRPCFLFFSPYVPQHDWPVADSFLQSEGDLGKRMQTAFEQLLGEYERVLLIGSDCPYLQQRHLEEAWAALEQREVVWGPAEDGGYYLIGLKKTAPALFERMAWSTEQVLSDSIRAAEELGWSYHLLEELSDVDYWQDWLDFQSSSSST